MILSLYPYLFLSFDRYILQQSTNLVVSLLSFYMSDFDLGSKWIQRGICGGSPQKDHILQKVKSVGLAFPVSVSVLKYSQYKAFDTKTRNMFEMGCWLMNVGDGLVYLTFAPNDNRIFEAIEECSDSIILVSSLAENWHLSVRKCIIHLRFKSLGLENDTEISQENEKLLYMKSINAYLDGSIDWIYKVKDWVQVVCIRHARKIHEIHRKMIDFILSCGREHDSLDHFCTGYIETLEIIQRCYEFEEMQALFISRLEQMRPFLLRIITIEKSVIGKVVELLKSDFKENLTVSEIGKRVHLSPEHLARRFKRETGYTLVEFLQQLRVQHASQLLRMTEWGLIEISADSGFGSMEQFHRIFKRNIGMTPGAYRKSIHRFTAIP